MHQFIRKTRILLASFVLCQLLGGSISQAATIELDAVDSGSWDGVTGRQFSELSYFVGFTSINPVRRNHFVFDLSGVEGEIVSATLRLFNPSNGFQSPDPTETYTLYDFTSSITELMTPEFPDDSGVIFGDLGSGVMFGSQVVSSDDNGQIISISLNADALTALNETSGLFAIGGAITTFRVVPDIDVGEFIFGSTGNPTDTRQLVLETRPIPEPSTILLLGTGLAGVMAFRYRTQKRSEMVLPV